MTGREPNQAIIRRGHLDRAQRLLIANTRVYKKRQTTDDRNKHGGDEIKDEVEMPAYVLGKTRKRGEAGRVGM